MREIKFRAWDRVEREIIEWEELKTISVLLAYLENCEKTDARILMQYTGLKDKNGKEIYEGDIVAIENSGNWEVIFKLGSFGFFQGDKKISDCYGITPKWEIIDKHGYVDGFEIIGNKYQHPELLQQ